MATMTPWASRLRVVMLLVQIPPALDGGGQDRRPKRSFTDVEIDQVRHAPGSNRPHGGGGALTGIGARGEPCADDRQRRLAGAEDVLGERLWERASAVGGA